MRGLRRRRRGCSCVVVEKFVGIAVMDVPVLLSDKFLQSKEFDQNAPQIQFIFECGTFLLCSGTVQPVQKAGDSMVLVQILGLSICLSICLLFMTRGAVVQLVPAALEFHSCGVLAVGAAAWGGRRFAAAFRQGVGAHHTGELN